MTKNNVLTAHIIELNHRLSVHVITVLKSFYSLFEPSLKFKIVCKEV